MSEFLVVCHDDGFVQTLERALLWRVAVVAVAICVRPTLVAIVEHATFAHTLHALGPAVHVLLHHLTVDMLTVASRQLLWVTSIIVALGTHRQALVAITVLCALLKRAVSMRIALATILRMFEHDTAAATDTTTARSCARAPLRPLIGNDAVDGAKLRRTECHFLLVDIRAHKGTRARTRGDNGTRSRFTAIFRVQRLTTSLRAARPCGPL